MGYQVLAVATIVVHYGFLGYVVLGGFLAWRWPRTIWVHFAAVAWGIVIIALRVNCPLTYLQDWARQQVGQPKLSGGFIGQYVEGVIYPARYTAVVQALAAVAVLVSWIGFTATRRPLRPARNRSRFRRR